MAKLTADQRNARLENAFQRASDLMVHYSVECCQLSGDAYFQTFDLRRKYAAAADSTYQYMEECAAAEVTW